MRWNYRHRRSRSTAETQRAQRCSGESAAMPVWTIQPQTVWEDLKRGAELQVEETLLPFGHVPEAYRWLVRALRRRLAHWPEALPWWVYCEKPDLRAMRHFRPLGSEEVRLELEPESGTVVTFPVWAWNTVYGGNYLTSTRDEYDAWMSAMRRQVEREDTWPLPSPWKEELEASWERLFDPNLPRLPWDRY